LGAAAWLEDTIAMTPNAAIAMSINGLSREPRKL
jgi:hypothetical protein